MIYCILTRLPKLCIHNVNHAMVVNGKQWGIELIYVYLSGLIFKLHLSDYLFILGRERERGDNGVFITLVPKVL